MNQVKDEYNSKINLSDFNTCGAHCISRTPSKDVYCPIFIQYDHTQRSNASQLCIVLDVFVNEKKSKWTSHNVILRVSLLGVRLDRSSTLTSMFLIEVCIECQCRRIFRNEDKSEPVPRNPRIRSGCELSCDTKIVIRRGCEIKCCFSYAGK